MDEESTVQDEPIKRASPWYVLGWIIVMIPIGLFLPPWIGLGLTWALIALLMLGAMAHIGLSLGKGRAGILIDPTTNTMSLSRFQVALWTWVILSAFVTLALARAWDSRTNPVSYVCPSPADPKAACAEPLGIQLPELLWALMGISLTSAVGGPFLKVGKATKTADQDGVNVQHARRRGLAVETAATYRAVLQERKEEHAEIAREVGDAQPLGALVRKDSWHRASFSDVYTGDEVATFGYVDVAKMQNLFFTLVAAVAYTVALVSALSAGSVAHVVAFPDLTAGLVALIGISHAGYLANHAVVHSVPTVPPEESI